MDLLFFYHAPFEQWSYRGVLLVRAIGVFFRRITAHGYVASWLVCRWFKTLYQVNPAIEFQRTLGLTCTEGRTRL